MLWIFRLLGGREEGDVASHLKESEYVMTKKKKSFHAGKKYEKLGHTTLGCHRTCQMSFL